ncbi:MAG: diguanylate cyclase [Burkholderiales bacterium]|nr:diguanylate cyclase [Burkholderiales bacterium]
MKFGIAVKLGILLAGVSILASGLTGFYAYQASRTILVQSAKADLLAATNVLAQRITLSREEISRNLQILAGHPAALAVLQGAGTAAENQLATLFEQVMLAHPGYFQIRLIAADDGGLEKVRLDRTEDSILRISEDDLQEKGHFLYVSGPLKLPKGSTYLSRIVINHERGAHIGLDQPSVIMATPVSTGLGQALGVVVINIDLNSVFAALSADLPKDYQLFLANTSGDYLVHPDSRLTFGFDKGRRVLVQDEFPQTRDIVDSKENKALIEVSDGRYATAPVVAAFVGRTVRVPGDEARLILGLAQPLATVLEQAHTLGRVVLQLVIGLCVACVFLAIVVARAVTRPINSMSNAVQNFAYAQKVATLPSTRQDEIGVLARSFNHMQDQIKNQLEELQRGQAELAHIARHDELTGLPNRRHFQERLDQALARAQRSGEHFALLFIDVDNFKRINDQWGHEGGDAVLQALALRLRSATRKVDTVARIGGDEFLVMLENPAHTEDVAHIAEKLLECIRSPIVYKGNELPVGFSIGISQYPLDGTTATDLMASSDHAMYAAKSAGRNRFRFSSSAG